MRRPQAKPGRLTRIFDADVTRLSREEQRERLVTVPNARWKPSQGKQARSERSQRDGSNNCCDHHNRPLPPLPLPRAVFRTPYTIRGVALFRPTLASAHGALLTLAGEISITFGAHKSTNAHWVWSVQRNITASSASVGCISRPQQSLKQFCGAFL